MIRFGISTHLFHSQPLAPRHFEAIAAAGFDLVEIFATRSHADYHEARRIGDLGRWLRDTGLEAGSVHLPICDRFESGAWGRAFSNASKRSDARTEAVAETCLALEAAARLGCGTAVLHVGLPAGQHRLPDDNDQGSFLRSLDTILPAAEAAGMQLALEVMVNDLSTPDALRLLFDSDADVGRAGVCLDLGHAHLLGGAPDAAETLAGLIVTTHVHDNHGRTDDHLVPFEGGIGWPEALMALFKTGYDGPLVFEVDGTADPDRVLPRVVGARRRLQAILDEFLAPFDFSDE